MQSAARRGGTAQLLRWLAVRTGATVVLVKRSGMVVSRPPSPLSGAERDLVLHAVRETTRRELKSVALEQKDLACIALPLDGPPEARTPLLAAVMPRPVPRDLPSLLADAATSLSLSWLLEHTRRQQRRLRIADARIREAVLHLLMNGQVPAARQVAAALRPALPDVLRVYVIEGPPAERGAVADALAAAAEGSWVVPCPVYVDHLALLAPAASEAQSGALPERDWPSLVRETCCIGVSDAVGLCDTATGYAQAFHALAVARQCTERYASFAVQADLALTIGPAATAWAEAYLAPVLEHRARRPQDPGSEELLATAGSWLSFSSHATEHLKIHRNTLTARLTLIQELLGLSLNRLPDRAALALALRALAARVRPHPEHRTAASAESPPCLDELLAPHHVLAWAQQQFHPVRAPEVPASVEQTLTTWLRSDAHIGLTADVLSLSASAVRKRLARSEVLLQRSLLRSPSAVHDQWLALRALDLAEHRSSASAQPRASA